MLAFAAVSIVLIVTPGPDMALVLRNTVRSGPTAGLRTVIGIGCGLTVWATASAIGVATVVAASREIFDVLRVVGAAYLVYLGVRALLRGSSSHARVRAGSPFRQGLLTNLLNPKLAVLFTTLLPQFVEPGDPAAKPALLAFLFVAIGLAWLVTYAHLVGAIVRRPRISRGLELLSGAVLIGLGGRLAVER